MAQHNQSTSMNQLPTVSHCQSPGFKPHQYAQHHYDISVTQPPQLTHEYTESTDSLSAQPRHSALPFVHPSNDSLAVEMHSSAFIELSTMNDDNDSNQSLYDVQEYTKLEMAMEHEQTNLLSTLKAADLVLDDHDEVLFHEEKLDPAYSASAQFLEIRPYIDHQPSLSTQHIPLPAPHRPSQSHSASHSAAHEYWQPMAEHVEQEEQEHVNKQYNQYMPKRKQEIEQIQRKHVYTMHAHFEDELLSVEVHDAVQHTAFRNEFTQEDFPQFDMFSVAKVLVDAIVDSNKKKNSGDQFPPITILEYGKWAYLTVNNGAQINGKQIPTFALRPI